MAEDGVGGEFSIELRADLARFMADLRQAERQLNEFKSRAGSGVQLGGGVGVGGAARSKPAGTTSTAGPYELTGPYDLAPPLEASAAAQRDAALRAQLQATKEREQEENDRKVKLADREMSRQKAEYEKQQQQITINESNAEKRRARMSRPAGAGRGGLGPMVGRQFKKVAMKASLGLIGVGMADTLMRGMAEGIASGKGFSGVLDGIRKHIEHLPIIGSAIMLGEALGEALLDSMFGDAYDTKAEAAAKALAQKQLDADRIRGSQGLASTQEDSWKREVSRRAETLRAIGDEREAIETNHNERMRQIELEWAASHERVAGLPQEQLAQKAEYLRIKALGERNALEERSLELAKFAVEEAKILLGLESTRLGVESKLAQIDETTVQGDAAIRFATALASAEEARASALAKIATLQDATRVSLMKQVAERQFALDIANAEKELQEEILADEISRLGLVNQIASANEALLLAQASVAPHLREQLEIEQAIAAAAREREIAYAKAAQEEDESRRAQLEGLADVQYQTAVLSAQERERMHAIERFRHSESGSTAIGAFKWVSPLVKGGAGVEDLNQLVPLPGLPATGDIDDVVAKRVSEAGAMQLPGGLAEAFGGLDSAIPSLEDATRELTAVMKEVAEADKRKRDAIAEYAAAKQSIDNQRSLHSSDKAKYERQAEIDAAELEIRKSQYADNPDEHRKRTLDKTAKRLEEAKRRGAQAAEQLRILDEEETRLRTAAGGPVGVQPPQPQKKEVSRADRFKAALAGAVLDSIPFGLGRSSKRSGQAQSMLPSFWDTEEFLRANPSKQVDLGFGGGKFDPYLGMDDAKQFGRSGHPADSPRMFPRGVARRAFDPAEFLRGMRQDSGQFMMGLESGGAPSIGSMGGDPQMARLLDVMTEVASHLRAQVS